MISSDSGSNGNIYYKQRSAKILCNVKCDFKSSTVISQLSLLSAPPPPHTNSVLPSPFLLQVLNCAKPQLHPPPPFPMSQSPSSNSMHPDPQLTVLPSPFLPVLNVTQIYTGNLAHEKVSCLRCSCSHLLKTNVKTK